MGPLTGFARFSPLRLRAHGPKVAKLTLVPFSDPGHDRFLHFAGRLLPPLPLSLRSTSFGKAVHCHTDSHDWSSMTPKRRELRRAHTTGLHAPGMCLNVPTWAARMSPIEVGRIGSACESGVPARPRTATGGGGWGGGRVQGTFDSIHFRNSFRKEKVEFPPRRGAEINPPRSLAPPRDPLRDRLLSSSTQRS